MWMFLYKKHFETLIYWSYRTLCINLYSFLFFYLIAYLTW